VLAPEEVVQVLACAPSLKARVMLTIGYGCGLRGGEVTLLKVRDIEIPDCEATCFRQPAVIPVGEIDGGRIHRQEPRRRRFGVNASRPLAVLGRLPWEHADRLVMQAFEQPADLLTSTCAAKGCFRTKRNEASDGFFLVVAYSLARKARIAC